MKKLISVLVAVCMLTAAFGLFSAVSAEGEPKMTMESEYVKMTDATEGIWEFEVTIENADKLAGDAWIGIYPQGATEEAIRSKEASLYTWGYINGTATGANPLHGTCDYNDTFESTHKVLVSDDWVESHDGVEPPQDGKTYDLILFYTDSEMDDYDGYSIAYRMSFTFGEAPAESDPEPIAPPQTADFSAAIVAVAVLALGATVVIAKKH